MVQRQSVFSRSLILGRIMLVLSLAGLKCSLFRTANHYSLPVFSQRLINSPLSLFVHHWPGPWGTNCIRQEIVLNKILLNQWLSGRRLNCYIKLLTNAFAWYCQNIKSVSIKMSIFKICPFYISADEYLILNIIVSNTYNIPLSMGDKHKIQSIIIYHLKKKIFQVPVCV